jgi:hypothetical protein
LAQSPAKTIHKGSQSPLTPSLPLPAQHYMWSVPVPSPSPQPPMLMGSTFGRELEVAVMQAEAEASQVAALERAVAGGAVLHDHNARSHDDEVTRDAPAAGSVAVGQRSSVLLLPPSSIPSPLLRHQAKGPSTPLTGQLFAAPPRVSRAPPSPLHVSAAAKPVTTPSATALQQQQVTVVLSSRNSSNSGWPPASPLPVQARQPVQATAPGHALGAGPVPQAGYVQAAPTTAASPAYGRTLLSLQHKPLPPPQHAMISASSAQQFQIATTHSNGSSSDVREARARFSTTGLLDRLRRINSLTHATATQLLHGGTQTGVRRASGL